MIGWLRRKFQKKPKVLVWGIIEGPVRAEDIPDCDYEEGAVAMILKISVDQSVHNAEFWFNNLDEAYQIIQHFNKSIEPLELNMKEFEVVQ